MDKEKLKNRINEFLNLKDNWDGYGALALDKELVDKANFIVDIMNDSFEDPNVLCSCTGVQFEWDYNDKFLELYVEKSYRMAGYLKGDPDIIDLWSEKEIENYNEINKLLEWLYK